MRTIITCPGIGDMIWPAMKLLNANEQFHVVMPDALPQRGHQVMEILPQLISSHEYRFIDNKVYRRIYRDNAARPRIKWKQLKANEFFLTANPWLESGGRIEDFLPDLSTTFYPEYTTNETDKVTAAKFVRDGVHIGIYTSAYSNERHWRGWYEKEWIEFIRLVHKEDKEIVFVMIGAPYDIDLTEIVMNQLKKDGIRYMNTVGQPLTTVLEIMKRLNYFVGFPSGLSILCSTLGKANTMFYPVHLQKLINTWADPKMIESGDYKGCLFTDPKNIFDWLCKQYSLFDKIYV